MQAAVGTINIETHIKGVCYMNTITEQRLEQLQAQQAAESMNQSKWRLLQPQKELCKSLIKLCGAQLLCTIIVEELNEIPAISSQGFNALNQLETTSFVAGLFTLFTLGSVWVSFIKSNRANDENNNSIPSQIRSATCNLMHLGARVDPGLYQYNGGLP
jgi:hypothetical protein